MSSADCLLRAHHGRSSPRGVYPEVVVDDRFPRRHCDRQSKRPSPISASSRRHIRRVASASIAHGMIGPIHADFPRGAFQVTSK